MVAIAATATLGAILTIVGAGCGSDSKGNGYGSSSAPATTVAATVKDFTLSLDKSSAAAGSIKFDITNQGPSDHEFVILKTDLAADKLPIKDNTVDTSASGVTSIAEAEDIGSGTSKSLTKSLDPGKYVMICNIAGHYQQGIHASFVVN
jgi:uncharacterized cupredoxin-like copper-binding protein